MAQANKVVVPSNAVRAGGNTIAIELTAGGAINPTNLVKYGADVSHVVVTASADLLCIGVADLNYGALAVAQNEWYAFASGDRVPVIMDGLVVCKADAAITAGTRVSVGTTTVYYCLTEAASYAGIQSGVGRCLTTAGASGDKIVVRLW